MPADLLLFTYVAGLLLALCLAGVYADLRRRRFRPTHAEDRIFRCSDCGHIYTDDPDVERSRCAQCGRLNEAIEF